MSDDFGMGMGEEGEEDLAAEDEELEEDDDIATGVEEESEN